MVKAWGRLVGWRGAPGRADAAGAPDAADAAGGPGRPRPGAATTKTVGDRAEDRALAHLLRQGLRLEARNYRLAGGPRQRGAEVDLILRDRDGTLVFVEVRARRGRAHGGAAASVSAAKQQRIVRAAQHYLLALPVLPPCRFDVVVIDGEVLQWLPGAFMA